MTAAFPVDPPFPVYIGRCIYCSAADGLTDEHVIPFSLGGEWKLLAASCPRCSRTTSAVERHVSREHLVACRTVLGLPTYHPKRRPKALPQAIMRGKTRLELSLAPESHPAPVVLPVFDPPTFVTGQETPPVPSARRVRVIARRTKIRELGEDATATGLGFRCPTGRCSLASLRR